MSIKLHFSLTDATHWMSDYNGFNYEEFYEFIVDFLEADQTLEGKAATTELYNWWNRCVCDDICSSRAGADASPAMYSQVPLQREAFHLHRSDNCRLRWHKNSAGLAYPVTLRSFVEYMFS